MSTLVPDAPGEVDLTTCDREPIHVPGSVQPHGVLLALEPRTLRVLQHSANIEAVCGSPPTRVAGASLAEALGAEAAEGIEEALAAGSLPERGELRVTVGSRLFDVMVHEHDGVAILELEPTLPTDDAVDLRRPLAALQAARSLAALLEIATEEVRALTGFDRVLVYRFGLDDHGCVVAESRAQGLEPYLGLHYPASDIPRQARELYLRNLLRIIPDATYTAAPLVPPVRPDTGAPLDLTFSVLRSVSPVHLEYMANMGVKASMSLSIVLGDRLWGLVSCGHRAPRFVPRRRRTACELLARLLSLQIGALEAIEASARRAERRPLLDAAVETIRASDDVLVGLAAVTAAALASIRADGMAVVADGAVRTRSGVAPAEVEITRLATWLTGSGRGPIHDTCALHREHEPAGRYLAEASGLLGLAMPWPGSSWLLLFRREVLRTVTWGGDPKHPATVGDTPARLHPRRSFERWKEEVRGTALPWSAIDLELAHDLRRHLIEVDLVAQMARARAAVQARDDLVAAISHDLRTPLGAMKLQLALLARPTPDARPPPDLLAFDRMRRSVDQMAALVDDLLDFASMEAGRFEVVTTSEPIGAVLSDAFEVLLPLAEARPVQLVVDPPPSGVRVNADRRRVVQVLSNLVGNAIKFTPPGGRIRVSVTIEGAFAVVRVSDTGPGVQPDELARLFDRYWRGGAGAGKPGVGLGLNIAKRIVEAHGGRIWASPEPRPGLHVSFSLPLAS